MATYRRRSAVLFLGVVLGLLVNSCSDDDSASKSTLSSAQKAVSSPKNAAPKAAVLRLWSEIAAGNPTLTSEYDPRLRRLLGSNLILMVFDNAPPEYSAPPRVKEIHRVRSGVLVRVEGKGPGQDDAVPVSFLVSKVGRRWLVRYDSNLLNRVRGQVAADVKRGLPRTKATEERASAVANRAVLAARALFTQGPKKGRVRRR